MTYPIGIDDIPQYIIIALFTGGTGPWSPWLGWRISYSNGVTRITEPGNWPGFTFGLIAIVAVIDCTPTSSPNCSATCGT